MEKHDTSGFAADVSTAIHLAGDQLYTFAVDAAFHRAGAKHELAAAAANLRRAVANVERAIAAEQEFVVSTSLRAALDDARIYAGVIEAFEGEAEGTTDAEFQQELRQLGGELWARDHAASCDELAGALATLSGRASKAAAAAATLSLDAQRPPQDRGVVRVSPDRPFLAAAGNPNQAKGECNGK